MFHKGKHDREKQLRFSIRKVSFGAASVAVAALFMFLGNGAVSAAEQSVPSTNGETQAPQPKEPNAQNGTYEGNTVATSPAATVATNTQPSTVENSPSPESAPQKVETLDKKELTDLIKEVDGKFAKGAYATKTEESVNNLRSVLEEARTDLSTATTKTELTAAYRKLITATSKLQTKSEKKKEQAVDNTSDKGSKSSKNASAEQPLESNSIANSGSRDERNGKALDTNNPFRTGTDAAPSTAASTDPLATNATNVAIVNGNFNDTSQGAELPTATSDPITVKNDISKLTGWKPVNSTTTTVPLIWTTKASQYGDSIPGDKGSRIGAVLAVYPGRGSGSGKQKPEFGPIYQDIDVVGGQEVKVTWRGTTVNINSGNNGAKLVVKNPETGAVLGQYARGYSGTPMGEMSVLVNVPEGLTKLRLQFETALNRSTENHTYNSSYNRPAISSNENAGGVVSNVRVASGSYLVSEVVNTTYESTATSATSATVDTTVTVKVINKGFSTSTNNQYRVELPEGATLVGTTGTSSAQLNGTSLTLGFRNLDPKREQTLTYTFSLPTTKPIEKNLEGTVSYQTSGNLIDNGTKKTGSDTVAQQTVKINMYKADLQAEAAKAATLNQSDYTPEAWAAYQAEVAKAQAILNEKTNNVEVANRKNQADINAQTLLLQKAKAKLDLEKAAAAEKAEIASDKSLTAAQRTEKEQAVDAAKTAEEAKIASAENADKVAEAKTAGVAAIAGVHTPGDLETNKEKALEAIQTASEAKIASIDKNAKLSDDEKAAAKAEVAKAAIAAVNAINEAKDQDGVDGAQTTGTTAINAVNPVGKEKALEAIQTASEAKIASIDKNAKLSDDEKAAAKAEVAQAAIAAVNAINEAKDQDGVDAAQTTGVKAIEAVNPVGTSSTNSAGNGITPPTVEVPAYTEPVGTSSTDGEGNVIIPPTAEVPAYTDPVGTSSTDGSGNVITPPTVEIPAYTDPVGTSSADGSGNVITPPTLEVPAYTDPVGTSSTDGDGNVITPPTVEVPAYTDPVGTSSTDGEGNVITPPTVEVPAYTDPVGTSNTDGDGNVITPPTVEVPAYTDPVGTSSTDGAGNVITPPTAEVPAYTEPVGTSSTAGDGNVVTPPTAEVPAYTGSVNGISEEMPAQPHKDGSANEMSDGTPVSETTINKDRQLPNTGTADSTVAMVAAAASAVLGLGLAGRRRKEDEEV